MEEPNFWDNPEEAQEQMKQLSSMKDHGLLWCR